MAAAQCDDFGLPHLNSENWLKSQLASTRHVIPQTTQNCELVEVEIPSWNLFRNLEVSEAAGSLPTKGQCAVHLELLHAFTALHGRVASSDKLDKRLNFEQVHRETNDGSTPEPKVAKWEFYLTIAAVRFIDWLATIHADLKDASMPVKLAYLPPIDVLITWHSLLLNTQWYRNFDTSSARTYSIQGRALEGLKDVPFPWLEIHQSIRREGTDWVYHLPEQDARQFYDKTGLVPDLLGFLEEEEKGSEVLLRHQVYENLSATARSSQSISPISLSEGVQAVQRSWWWRPQQQQHSGANVSDPVVKRLVAAVQRQLSFANKMRQQLWLLSPAVEGTLLRAIDRYEKFLRLFRLYPKDTLVPTLDIDLVWHTHQCSPAVYDQVCAQIAGRRINHDDTVSSSKLSASRAKTAELFRIRFLEDYSACKCWECELLLSALEHESQFEVSEAFAPQVREKVNYYRRVYLVRSTGQSLAPQDKR